MTITILDGGMGQELVARSPEPPTGLWSTKIMMDHAHLVRDVHKDYFAAGAQIATANTYAIHHDRLITHDIDDQFETLHNTALDMAMEAVAANGSGKVAASIGPLGWSYRPDLTPEHSKAVQAFHEIANLHAAKADILLGETVCSLAEIKALVEATKGIDTPLWIAMSVDDSDGTKLRSGEPVESVLGALGHAQAVLLNCSLPEVISDGLAVIAKTSLPFGAYANGFTNITDAFAQAGADVGKLEARTDLGPEAYAEFALKWADQGATIIGGCCEVGPAHIKQLCATLADAGHSLS